MIPSSIFGTIKIIFYAVSPWAVLRCSIENNDSVQCWSAVVSSYVSNDLTTMAELQSFL